MKAFIFFCLCLFAYAASGSARAGTLQWCQGRTHVPGSDTVVLCSKLWQFTATCTNTDGLASLSDGKGFPGINPVTGKTDLIPPWEGSSITIRKIDVGVTDGTIRHLMVGNSHNQDMMFIMGHGQTSGSATFPSGSGFQFPAPDGTYNSILDIHIACEIGQPAAGFLIVTYTVP